MSRLLMVIGLLLVSTSVLWAPIHAEKPSGTWVHGALLGGPGFYPGATGGYDPVTAFRERQKLADRNGNGLDDSLEASLARASPGEPVGVIVVFSSRPVALGGDEDVLSRGLSRAVMLAGHAGFKLTRGAWIHAIVGFAGRISAGNLTLLSNVLRGVDIDGDGVSDSFLVSPDRMAVALNYWSSGQMGVRPVVWSSLGVRGEGVTIAVLDTGIDGVNSAFPSGKIVYWKDYTGDSNGNPRNQPYDDNGHGTHVAGSIAGYYDSMDSDGRLVFNFGISDLDWTGAPTNTWLFLRVPYMGFYVNSTGTIEIDFKWKGDTSKASSPGAFQEIGLGFCGNVTLYSCSPQLVAEASTPNSDTWYTLSYSVDGSSKYGFYTVLFKLSKDGGLAFLPVIHVPVYKEESSGVPYMAGIAPNASLAGAKVLDYSGHGSYSDIISAIDDVVANRTKVNPEIYVLSMSLGGPYDSSLDTAISNAANAGILPVVAAGNSGAGSGGAASDSPACNPYALTVAAVDAFNNVTFYSSDGGQSQSDSSVLKPDLAAPGGGYYLMVLSADTTWHDDRSNFVSTLFGTTVDIDWSDVVNVEATGYDDSTGMMGTSMATPHVSGAAALVASALIYNDSVSWSWSDYSTAGLVKTILIISTYETYPLMREPNNLSYSPTLDKGGKDIHEGYGALDARAAVELALSYGSGRALLPGSVVSTVFRDGVAYKADFQGGEWSYPAGRSVWASRVYLPVLGFTLQNGSKYNVTYVFKLVSKSSDPGNTDLDLYLYEPEGDSYGEPVVIGKSTGDMGATIELVWVNTEEHSLVVAAKRAREDSAGGPAYILVGPTLNATGYSEGSGSESYAYMGGTVVIKGFSATAADNVVIEVYDNTTGSLLDKITATPEQHPEGYSDFMVNWTVPDDPSLENHVLLFIASYNNSIGVTEGPAIDSLTVSEPPTPVPEPWWTALAIGGIIALAYIAASKVGFARLPAR